mgnify:CR=1 FL=1
MGSGENRPDSGVGAFVSGVGDPVEPGVGDFFEPQAEGAGQPDERWKPGALGPGDPPFEEQHRFVEAEGVVGVDPAQAFLSVNRP